MKVTNRNNQISLTLCASVVALVMCMPSFALSLSDIKADDLNFDLAAGTFTATGSVKIESDEFTLNADEVNALVQDTQLISINAKGKPLNLEIEVDSDDDDSKSMRATAGELTYNNTENWVEFSGNVELETDVANIRAETIRIDLESQKIVAAKGKDGEQVEITLREEESP